MARLHFPQWLLYAAILAFFPVALAAQTTAPIVRPKTPKPASARPTGLISVSTAESGGLHDRAPLHRLPSFQVTKLDGKAVDIASLQQPKHWLLLYRRENCPACDRVLKTFAESDNALLKSGTELVVVVADNGNTRNRNRLDATRAQFSTLTGAAWLEDSTGAALKALKPRGTPMLYALSGDRIRWSLPGVPADPAMLNKMAASWVSTEDPKFGPAAGATANASPTPAPSEMSTAAIAASLAARPKPTPSKP